MPNHSYLKSSVRDAIIAHNLDFVSASQFSITDEMLALAHKLSRIHGRVRVTNEASGIHFYMPCPECLENEGDSELYKMHLAVNATKYTEEDVDNCGMCMKTSKPFRVTDLESMIPLDKRGHELKPEVIKVAKVQMEHMEQDANGAWIPKGPGKVVPVYTLPADHPAQVYLKSRDYDPELLWEQFRLSYCEEERTDVFYGRMLNGFRRPCSTFDSLL